MITLSGFLPVGRSLPRAKTSSWLPTSLVIGEKFRELLCFSHYPPSRSIATTNYNPNILGLPKKRQLQVWKNGPCTRRHQSSNHTTATVSDEHDDDVHRFRYQLYKYKICPFSNIAKTLLEYKKIPFESVEVNPLTKAELGFSENYRKVPIVTVLDSAATTPAAKAFQQLNGTEEILPYDYGLSGIGSDGDAEEFSSSESSILWQDFARNKLAPLLYPNICRTLGDSFRAFDYVHSNSNTFSTVQRYSIQYVGSIAMYFAASKIKEKYKIDDVQVALDEVLAELELELSNNNNGSSNFLGPSSNVPHLGDLSVFGVLKGIEGLPLWNSIFDDDSDKPSFPNIRQWYANVGNAVETRKLRTPRYGFNN